MLWLKRKDQTTRERLDLESYRSGGCALSSGGTCRGRLLSQTGSVALVHGLALLELVCLKLECARVFADRPSDFLRKSTLCPRLDFDRHSDLGTELRSRLLEPGM